MLRRTVYWSVQFAVLLVVWLLFVDSQVWSEIVVGIGAAILAATAGEAVRRQEPPRFFPEARWVMEIRRVPARILGDCVLLARNLWRTVFTNEPAAGSFVAVPFGPGRERKGSPARRALAILYTTLPPNSIVIGIDRQRGRMLVHVLERAGR